MSINLFRFMSEDLAIDLGTANTLIYAKGKGIVLNEPSVVAVKRGANGNGPVVLAVGKEASRMLGKVPKNIEAVKPMREGVIADFEMTQAMLRHFILRVHRRRKFVRPRMIISVPWDVTPVEKKAVKETADSAGASRVYLIEEPVATAIGAGLPVAEPIGSMIVNVGGGTTEVAVISLAKVVYCKSVRVAGDRMDDAIVQHMRRHRNLLIGPGTAEKVKKTIGSAFPNGEREMFEVKGRDLVTGRPSVIEIDSEEVRTALQEPVGVIIDTIREAFEQCPPELSADILDHGIVLSGGGSCLKYLDRLIVHEIGISVHIASEPLFTVAIGAGHALDDLDLLEKVSVRI
ncbi:MAG: rod shape-determining protein [Syntrophales bacterium]|nr:rod shape-determining protein [Syntrophales bacterium]MDD5234115.1 rod shape-determining protein [Syntrophales bacterium]MDD5533895.1 rod shape-determining protein [Syntrophales bacterium]